MWRDGVSGAARSCRPLRDREGPGTRQPSQTKTPAARDRGRASARNRPGQGGRGLGSSSDLFECLLDLSWRDHPILDQSQASLGSPTTPMFWHDSDRSPIAALVLPLATVVLESTPLTVVLPLITPMFWRASDRSPIAAAVLPLAMVVLAATPLIFTPCCAKPLVALIRATTATARAIGRRFMTVSSFAADAGASVAVLGGVRPS